MKIIEKPLTNGQYLTQEYEKRAIFLHHTVGLSAMSAWRWWNHTPSRVGTAYIIDRDGTIIQCFPPELWAYHLGLKGDNYQDKQSIGIELVSAGPLRKVGDKFMFFPLWPNKAASREIPKDEVIEFKNHWRGFQYYHKYTDEQIKATEELVAHLQKRFKGIGKNEKPEEFYQYNEKVIYEHTPGIWSHTTVRADKSDIYPDTRLIDMVKKLSGKEVTKKAVKKSKK